MSTSLLSKHSPILILVGALLLVENIGYFFISGSSKFRGVPNSGIQVSNMSLNPTASPLELMCPVPFPADSGCSEMNALAPDSILCLPPSLLQYKANILRDFQWSSSSSWHETVGAAGNPRVWMLDVGANLGCSLLGAASAGHRVLAFEPATVNVRYLSATICASGLENKVELVQAAVGEREGTATFFSHTTRGDNSAMTASAAGIAFGQSELERSEVPLTSIDGYLARNADRWNPSDCIYVKIDVQGNELRVLEGARGLLAAAASANPAHFVVRAEQDSSLELAVLGFSGGVLSLMPTLGFERGGGGEGGDVLWKPTRP